MDNQTEGLQRAGVGGLVGFLVSGFAAACCLGAAPAIGFLVTIGLGFLISDLILVPILVAGILVVIWSTVLVKRRSGARWPLILALGSGVATIAGVWVSPVVSVVGLVGLGVATSAPLLARILKRAD